MKIDDNELDCIGESYAMFYKIFAQKLKKVLPFYLYLEYELGRKEIRKRDTITRMPSKNSYYIAKASELETHGMWK